MSSSAYIIVLSNASTQLYDNSLSKFNNRLPQNVAIGEEYKIAFQSILIDNKFAADANIPKILKIRLEEMSDCLSNTGFNKDLALVYGADLSSAPFYHIVKKKEYFNIGGGSLSNITITLLDENNQQLQLLDGQPTIVTLKIKKIKMTSRIMRLSSKDSTHLFEDSSCSDFKILLNEQIDKRKKYEVALSSIYLPPKIDVKKIVRAQELYAMFSRDGETWEKVSFDQLEDLNSDTVAQVLFDNAPKLDSEDEEAEEEYIFDVERENGKIILKCLHNFYLQFSQFFSYMFNVRRTGEMKPGDAVAIDPPNFERIIPNAIFLYTNFTTPLITGDVFARVLKVIPYKNARIETTLSAYESNHFEFVPISMNEDNLLHFHLRDASGNLIPFENENRGEVLVNLILRENCEQ
jgi:hypothetical protein